MELPSPDVPVCKMPHKDEEGLMQPADQLSQPPIIIIIIIIIIKIQDTRECTNGINAHTTLLLHNYITNIIHTAREYTYTHTGF